MDREQYSRVVISDSISTLIDNWYICPYSDKVDEMFHLLNACVEAYLDLRIKRIMNTMVRVNIVKDMREMLNPHRNENLYYFTDRICDEILKEFVGATGESLEDFNAYTEACLLHVYTRV